MQRHDQFRAPVRAFCAAVLTGSLLLQALEACSPTPLKQPRAAENKRGKSPPHQFDGRVKTQTQPLPTDPSISPSNSEPVPYHLEAKIFNPYDSAASVSSAPPTHHVTVNFGEEFSLDLVRNAGSVGRDVWFKAEAMAPASAVRGRVLKGGKDALVPLCKSNVWAHGGGGLQILVEALYNGTWTPVGWVLYGHIQELTVADGDVIASPTIIAKVTGLRDNITCSTGGHLHLGFRNLDQYPCWATARNTLVDGPIAQLGGSHSLLALCPTGNG